MKIGTIIFTLLTAFMAVPSNAQNQLGDTQLKAQQERLQGIERRISTERHEIERWYQSGIDELLQEYARRFQRSDMFQRRGTEELLWIQFFEYLKFATHDPEQVGHFHDVLRPFKFDGEANRLRRELLDNYFIIVTRPFLTDGATYDLLAEMAYGQNRSPLVRHKARRLLTIMKEFAAKLAALDNRKAARLANLQQTEQRLRGNIYRVISHIEAQPLKLTYGVVSAIGYDENNPICMIDGVNNILEPGSTIKDGQWKDAKIVKIHRFKVDFQQNAKTWTQKIGQLPK